MIYPSIEAIIGEACLNAASKSVSIAGLTLSIAASRITRIAPYNGLHHFHRDVGTIIGIQALGCRDSGGLLKPQLLDCDLAHLVLLDLAGHRHRELVDEFDVARDLIVRDLAAAEIADLLGGRALAL